MKILDKAAKLEKALLQRLGRRSDIPRHPIELYRAVLEEIEEACEPGAGDSRVFPYHAVTVTVPATDPRRRATIEAVFTEPPALESRVRSRLAELGCLDAERVAVTLKVIDATESDDTSQDYRIEYRRNAARQTKRATERAATKRELHLTVLAGTALKSRYRFDEPRINLGRLADVLDRQQRVVRRNQVAFLDNEDAINQSVSRTHAHIQVDASHEAHLHDDGSTHGTRVVRAGRTINVPRHAGRGVKLRDGDELILGQARLRLDLRDATSRPQS
jgi:hypothetical protein